MTAQIARQLAIRPAVGSDQGAAVTAPGQEPVPQVTLDPNGRREDRCRAGPEVPEQVIPAAAPGGEEKPGAAEVCSTRDAGMPICLCLKAPPRAERNGRETLARLQAASSRRPSQPPTAR